MKHCNISCHLFSPRSNNDWAETVRFADFCQEVHAKSKMFKIAWWNAPRWRHCKSDRGPPYLRMSLRHFVRNSYQKWNMCIRCFIQQRCTLLWEQTIASCKSMLQTRVSHLSSIRQWWYEGGFDRPLPRLQANRVMLDFGLLRHSDRLDKTLSYKKSLYIATAGSREAHQYTCTPRVLDCRTVCWQLNTLGWLDFLYCKVWEDVSLFQCIITCPNSRQAFPSKRIGKLCFVKSSSAVQEQVTHNPAHKLFVKPLRLHFDKYKTQRYSWSVAENGACKTLLHVSAVQVSLAVVVFLKMSQNWWLISKMWLHFTNLE